MLNGILINNLKNSEIEQYPFEHSTFTLFDKEMCSKLSDNIYEIKHVMRNNLKGLSSSRYMISISGDTKNGIDFSDHTFLKKIEPLNSVLKTYSDCLVSLIYEKYYTQNPEILKFTIDIVFDTENYIIGPHTDHQKRNITQVTYLVPEKDTGKNLGVSLYKDLINRHKDKWLRQHYSFENFKKCKQIEYFSGSTVNFKVHKESFHGVEKVNDCDRLSLQLIIWK